MEMFNAKTDKERIGPLKKSNAIEHLREVEIYYLRCMKKYNTETSYDVIAGELPYFKTLNYTEYAGNFTIQPLNIQLRLQQFRDAEEDDVEILDYAEFLRTSIEGKIANKYQDREDKGETFEKVGHIVVLPGSNKLKERTCLNKLMWIRDTHDTDVYFKPHPITTHAFIGEMKDLLGEKRVLPRDVDLYQFFEDVHTVYTTHISESCIYAAVLGKDIEPIDVWNMIDRGSFYCFNRNLFRIQAEGGVPDEWINKVFSSPRSGVINPLMNKNWKDSVDEYLEYIHKERKKYKNWYIESKKKKKK